MTTENKLNEIVEDLKNQVLAGVTFKNIRRGLEFKKVPAALIDKLIRLTELKISLSGC